MIKKEDIEYALNNVVYEDEYGDPYEVPHYLKMDTPKPLAGKLYDPTFNPYFQEGGSLPGMAPELSPANTAKSPKKRKQVCAACGAEACNC